MGELGQFRGLGLVRTLPINGPYGGDQRFGSVMLRFSVQTVVVVS